MRPDPRRARPDARKARPLKARPPAPVRPATPGAGRVVLRRGRDHRARAGHLWIYAGEIERILGDPEPGSAVQVVDTRGEFLGGGYYNPASNIAVRLVTREPDEVYGPGLLRRRIEAALAYRSSLGLGGDVLRLVSSDGDHLPGLTVDRYGDQLVMQIGTLGIDRLRGPITEILVDLVGPRGIFERSDLPARSHEGLGSVTGVLHGDVPDSLEVEVDGLRQEASIRSGQKTGLFLDHRPNRLALRSLAPGRRVLDVFCNTGGFALSALLGGAREAVGIDSSAEALAAAARNAARNGLEQRVRFVEGNAFDRLKEMDRRGERFDLIVLDPPAFTKNRDSVDAARRGYKEINLRALRMAAQGGVVVSASCSYHIGPESFLDILVDAAADAGREVTLLSYGSQGPDHPVNLAMPETRYLKCAFLAVRDAPPAP
ncbi:MAG TPA: class I SAM-dependent rRNA methyltransferase [Verrucomicrobiae bacterium]|nr:class I SAM-dependent rRNA methyltransferase [Verrucomicrobiae bacterium]